MAFLDKMRSAHDEARSEAPDGLKLATKILALFLCPPLRHALLYLGGAGARVIRGLSFDISCEGCLGQLQCDAARGRKMRLALPRTLCRLLGLEAIDADSVLSPDATGVDFKFRLLCAGELPSLPRVDG